MVRLEAGLLHEGDLERLFRELSGSGCGTASSRTLRDPSRGTGIRDGPGRDQSLRRVRPALDHARSIADEGVSRPVRLPDRYTPSPPARSPNRGVAHPPAPRSANSVASPSRGRRAAGAEGVRLAGLLGSAVLALAPRVRLRRADENRPALLHRGAAHRARPAPRPSRRRTGGGAGCRLRPSPSRSSRSIPGPGAMRRRSR